MSSCWAWRRRASPPRNCRRTAKPGRIVPGANGRNIRLCTLEASVVVVCVFVCMYVQMYVCMCVCIAVYVHVYVSVCTVCVAQVKLAVPSW